MLTALCLRSKAVWGYSEQFMCSCRAELTLTGESIASSHFAVAEVDGLVMRIVELRISHMTAELEKLFVEPGSLRSGVGHSLFTWAKDRAKQIGASRLVIHSDPGAADFYRRLGASDNGTVSSGSIPGRVIPRASRSMYSGNGMSA
jgi:GNAT superfamily N-acetyltransferase